MSEFLSRPCPACGTAAGSDEVHSERRAEAMSLDELRPFWSGLFKEKVFFSYVRCPTCGLLYAPQFFTPDQLGELYADMAPNMALVPGDALAATQRGYWEAARRVAPLTGGFLEIGPDVGPLVRYAAQEGQFDHFWSFEPNRAVHAQLHEASLGKPHTISVDMDDLSEVPDGSVGLAFMVHVLDHLLDPMAMLRQIRSKLKPDGILAIVTHNEASTLRRLMGVKFPPFCLQHPELYNPRSIKAVLNRADFGQVEVERSKNFFPLSFMVRQAAWTAGMNLDRLPLPKTAVGLRLGNMMTTARA